MSRHLDACGSASAHHEPINRLNGSVGVGAVGLRRAQGLELYDTAWAVGGDTGHPGQRGQRGQDLPTSDKGRQGGRLRLGG